MVVVVRQFPTVGTQQRKQRVGQRASHVYLVELALLRNEAEVVGVALIVDDALNAQLPVLLRSGVVYVIAVIVGHIFVVAWHSIRVYTAGLYHLLTDVLGRPGGSLP